MQILSHFCLLVVICTVLNLHKRFLQSFLGFLVMDCASCLTFLSQGNGFGCGFFVFGYFSHVFNFLGLFYIIGLCLKFLQYGWHGKDLMQFLCEFRGKSSGFRNGVPLKNGAGEVSDSKIMSCERESLKLLENSKSQKQAVNSNGDALEENDDDKKECHGEDEEFDVMALRKLVKIERQRANSSYAELEKERMAAASAAEEAMAMILRLQREKSSIEIQANQYRRLAEQKQQYDQEVIQSLRWVVMKHESNRSLLEDQLRFCRQKLKLCTMKGNEVDHGPEGVDASMRFLNSSTEHGFDDVLISSLDMDSSML